MQNTRIAFNRDSQAVSGRRDQVIGCVDGVIEGELRGWIVNLDHPGRTESVFCYAPDGRATQFRPLMMRADVNQALGVDGVFGFAIPVDLLRSSGGSVTVMDGYGGVLDNGVDVALGAAVEPAGPRILNAFLHISKTAGTSLRNTLLRTVPPGEQVLIYPGATPGIPSEQFHRIPMHQRSGLRWLFGHCKFGLDRFLTQSTRYITFVRDPLERLRSNYAHHAAAGTVFRIGGERMSGTTVINEGLSEEFDNVMTRVLTGLGQAEVPLGAMGEGEVELAIRNIRAHFLFVGQHERAAGDTRLLQDFLGLPPDPLTTDNVTPREMRYSAREVENVDWPLVMARNAADVLLCARLRQERLLSRILPGPARRHARAAASLTA